MSIRERNNIQIVGDGPRTVVLAHGFGADQRAWARQVEALRTHFRVVLFDHVGATAANESAFSRRRYSHLGGYAHDLLEVLDELSVEKVLYVGHSMSGMVGLLAAVARPDLFDRLIFIGASPRYLNDTDYVGGLSADDLGNIYAAMGTNFQAWASGFAPLAMGNPERPELSQSFAQTLSSIRPDIGVAVAHTIFDSDHRADLAGLQLPTLIVQSGEDIAVPDAVGVYLSEHIPGARLVRANARGHHPHVSAPDAINRILLDYLTPSSVATAV